MTQAGYVLTRQVAPYVHTELQLLCTHAMGNVQEYSTIVTNTVWKRKSHEHVDLVITKTQATRLTLFIKCNILSKYLD